MDDENDQRLVHGDSFGQYNVVSLLGQGGMGQVYEVRHKVLETRHALKLIHPQVLEHAEGLQYFRNEAKVMAQLRHPGIVEVDDFGQTDGQYWLRSELITGIECNGASIVSLDQYLEHLNGLPHEREITDFLRQTLEAIGYAHSKGVIHCDLKPANILLHPQGVKIADFGIVRLFREDWLLSEVEPVINETQKHSKGELDATESAIVGTYEFMSPEQRKGLRVDGRSDLYSIGLLAFRMITGREIPGLKRASEIRKGLHGTWDRWLEKSLEENPNDRFANARDMLTALPKVRTPTWFSKAEKHNAIFITSESAAAHSQEVAENRVRKSPFVRLLGTLGVITLIGSLIWMIYNLPQDRGRSIKRPLPPPGSPNPETPKHIPPPPYTPKLIPPPNETIPKPVPITQPPQPNPPPIPTEIEPNPLRPMQPELPNLLEKTGKTPQPGKPFILKNPDIELQWIPAGKFLMGSPTHELQRVPHEGPQHEVNITVGFWMGKTEVTIKQWNQTVPETPRLGKERIPVTSVSWAEARKFCKALNLKQNPRLPNQEIRLPTEAGWEYACRSGSTNSYSFGSERQNLQSHSWYGKNANGFTHPVGVLPSNRFGLHDMHGNVREWCNDRYLNKYAEGIQTNPIGPKTGDLRVTRGGSWQLFESYCRSAARKGERPSAQSGDLGLRIVLAPKSNK